MKTNYEKTACDCITNAVFCKFFFFKALEISINFIKIIKLLSDIIMPYYYRYNITL